MSSVLLKDTSSASFFSIFFTAYITVVWSRPPNNCPMSGKEQRVISHIKNIATYRSIATTLYFRSERSSEIFTP